MEENVVRNRRHNVTENGNSKEVTSGRPDRPYHRQCESLFSSRSGFHNYRGLLNDCIILLILSNSKNVATNLYKYGIRINPLSWGMFLVGHGNPRVLISWGLFFLSFLYPLLALKLEQLTVKGHITSRALFMMQFIMLFFILTFPVGVTFVWESGPVESFLVLMWHTVLWLKMVSYAQVNMWCREDYLAGKKDKTCEKDDSLVHYPDNLYAKDVYYFCFAPTLCYELNFPRSPKIRKIFLIRRVLETVFLMNVVLAICQQWLMPTVLNSIQPFKEMAYTKIIERVLLLAIPNHLMWLISFYCIFHSMFNMSAEVLRFGDREFYKDWWNAYTISGFWSMWNIPVHRWAYRHFYNPLRSRGCNKPFAVFSVFALSAFFHEYLVSIPLRMLRMWAFVGMISQLPLGIVTSHPFMRGQIGNAIVWTSIILGQPIAILMYLHDYYWLNWAVHEVARNVTMAT